MTAIGAIGSGDDRSNNVSYTSSVKKRNPWEEIGAAMTGVGSYLANLPADFNSAFTVAGKQGGSDTQGAARL